MQIIMLDANILRLKHLATYATLVSDSGWHCGLTHSAAKGETGGEKGLGRSQPNPTHIRPLGWPRREAGGGPHQDKPSAPAPCSSHLQPSARPFVTSQMLLLP